LIPENHYELMTLAVVYGAATAAVLALRVYCIRNIIGIRKYLDAGPWGDAICYFLQTHYYRNNSGTELDAQCLFRGNTLHTPSVYQRAIGALCNDKTLWNVPWLPNLILYVVFFALFFTIVSPIERFGHYEALLLLAALFLVQADNSLFDYQSIHYLTLQPRYLGLQCLSIASLAFAFVESPAISLVVGSAAMSIALNTSIFSRQVAYFVFPLIALLSVNPLPLLYVVVGILASLAFNKEEFIESSLAQYRYAKYYLDNRKVIFETRPGAGLSYFIRKHFAPACRYLYKYADSFVAIVGLAFIYIETGEKLSGGLLATIVAAAIVCFLTAFRSTASFGECWRYISFNNYYVTPVALVYCAIHFQIPVIPLISVAVAIIVISLAASKRNSSNFDNPNNEISAMLHDTFPNRPETGVWWSAHYRYGSVPVAMGYGKSTFEIQGTDLSQEVMDAFFKKYPFLHINEEFLEKHSVKYFLISKTEWPEAIYGAIEDTVKRFRILRETEKYLILERETAR
jgi:hypothetical protein